jgi:hypothetical protein
MFDRYILTFNANRRCVHPRVGAALHLVSITKVRIFAVELTMNRTLQLRMLLYECTDYDTRLLLHCCCQHG